MVTQVFCAQALQLCMIVARHGAGAWNQKVTQEHYTKAISIQSLEAGFAFELYGDDAREVTEDAYPMRNS